MLVSGVAVLVSLIFGVISTKIARASRATAEKSVAEAKRSADAADRSADAAVSTARVESARHHEERRPRLSVALDPGTVRDSDRVIYRVTHDASVDLDSVVVHRPVLGEVEGGIKHEVARTGRGSFGNEAQVGPIGSGTYERFTLHVGNAPVLPAFRVEIIVRIGDEEWPQIVKLADPRNMALEGIIRPRGADDI